MRGRWHAGAVSIRIMGYTMVQAVAGGAGGVFATAAKQFQAKAQAAFQKLQAGATTAAANGVSVSGSSAAKSATSGLAAFLDPETARKLEAMKEETSSLVKKLSSGGESSKEAAARKKDEAKQKLKMLKLQAQLAAASGDKKAAARIAKEAAQVAKELGQAVKERGGGDAEGTAAQAAPAEATGTEAAAATGAEASAAAAPAGATEGQTTNAPASATPSAEGASAPAPQAQAEGTAAPTDAAAAAAGAAPAPPATDAASGKAGTGEAKDATDAAKGKDAGPTDFQKSIEDKRNAIMKDGAARKAEMEFQEDTRRVMDELRSIHRQMKTLARKDGSVGTAAEMDQAGRDMAEGDRMVSDAFSSSTGAAGATAAPTLNSIDIRV